MTLLTAATEAGKTITVTQDVPWGTIAIAIAAVLVTALVTYMQVKNKGLNAKVKVGDKEIQIGDTDQPDAYTGPDRRATVGGICVEDGLDVRAVQLAQIVARRRWEAVDSARVRQKDLTEDMEDDFWPIFDRRGVNGWQTEGAWNRLALVLHRAADQNHFLSFVHEGRAEQGYLNEKVLLFKRRYEKTLKRPDCELPPFPMIEEELRSMIHTALVRFAEISQDEQDKLRTFVDQLKLTTDNDQIRQIIDVSAGFEVA
jgi:hypothetical protein